MFETRIRRKKWRIYFHNEEMPAKIRRLWINESAQTAKQIQSGTGKQMILVGQTYRLERAIVLRKRKGWQATLLHELIHASVNENNIVISDALEEKFIQQIESPLFQALSQLGWSPK